MTYEVANGTIKGVHGPTACAGENCCIHNPSAHSMLSFPQHFGRRGTVFMERECPHGFFHPDPDDPKTKNWVERRHNCDGCCSGCYVGFPRKPDWWSDELHTPDRRLLINQAECRKCGDIITSKSVHDFVECGCGAISVDGGNEYQHCSADSWENFIDLSVYEEINNVELTEFQPRWEDPRPSLRGSAGPPKPKGQRTPRAEFWDLAKTRPGEWLLAKVARSTNGQRKKWLESQGFEVVARKNEAGTYNIYVRYIGSSNDDN